MNDMYRRPFGALFLLAALLFAADSLVSAQTTPGSGGGSSSPTEANQQCKKADESKNEVYDSTRPYGKFNESKNGAISTKMNLYGKTCTDTQVGKGIVTGICTSANFCKCQSFVDQNGKTQSCSTGSSAGTTPKAPAGGSTGPGKDGMGGTGSPTTKQAPATASLPSKDGSTPKATTGGGSGSPTTPGSRGAPAQGSSVLDSAFFKNEPIATQKIPLQSPQMTDLIGTGALTDPDFLKKQGLTPVQLTPGVQFQPVQSITTHDSPAPLQGYPSTDRFTPSDQYFPNQARKEMSTFQQPASVADKAQSSWWESFKQWGNENLVTPIRDSIVDANRLLSPIPNQEAGTAALQALTDADNLYQTRNRAIEDVNATRSALNTAQVQREMFYGSQSGDKSMPTFVRKDLEERIGATPRDAVYRIQSFDKTTPMFVQKETIDNAYARAETNYNNAKHYYESNFGAGNPKNEALANIGAAASQNGERFYNSRSVSLDPSQSHLVPLNIPQNYSLAKAAAFIESGAPGSSDVASGLAVSCGGSATCRAAQGALVTTGANLYSMDNQLGPHTSTDASDRAALASRVQDLSMAARDPNTTAISQTTRDFLTSQTTQPSFSDSPGQWVSAKLNQAADWSEKNFGVVGRVAGGFPAGAWDAGLSALGYPTAAQQKAAFSETGQYAFNDRAVNSLWTAANIGIGVQATAPWAGRTLSRLADEAFPPAGRGFTGGSLGAPSAIGDIRMPGGSTARVSTGGFSTADSALARPATGYTPNSTLASSLSSPWTPPIQASTKWTQALAREGTAASPGAGSSAVGSAPRVGTQVPTGRLATQPYSPPAYQSSSGFTAPRAPTNDTMIRGLLEMNGRAVPASIPAPVAAAGSHPSLLQRVVSAGGAGLQLLGSAPALATEARAAAPLLERPAPMQPVRLADFQPNMLQTTGSVVSAPIRQTPAVTNLPLGGGSYAPALAGSVLTSPVFSQPLTTNDFSQVRTGSTLAPSAAPLGSGVNAPSTQGTPVAAPSHPSTVAPMPPPRPANLSGGPAVPSAPAPTAPAVSAPTAPAVSAPVTPAAATPAAPVAPSVAPSTPAPVPANMDIGSGPRSLGEKVADVFTDPARFFSAGAQAATGAKYNPHAQTPEMYQKLNEEAAQIVAARNIPGSQNPFENPAVMAAAGDAWYQTMLKHGLLNQLRFPDQAVAPAVIASTQISESSGHDTSQRSRAGAETALQFVPYVARALGDDGTSPLKTVFAALNAANANADMAQAIRPGINRDDMLVDGYSRYNLKNPFAPVIRTTSYGRSGATMENKIADMVRNTQAPDPTVADVVQVNPRHLDAKTGGPNIRDDVVAARQLARAQEAPSPTEMAEVMQPSSETPGTRVGLMTDPAAEAPVVPAADRTPAARPAAPAPAPAAPASRSFFDTVADALSNLAGSVRSAIASIFGAPQQAPSPAPGSTEATPTGPVRTAAGVESNLIHTIRPSQFAQRQPVKPPDPIVLSTINDAAAAMGEIYRVAPADIAAHAQAVGGVGHMEAGLRADRNRDDCSPLVAYCGPSQTDHRGAAENIMTLDALNEQIESGLLPVSRQTAEKVARWNERAQQMMREGKDTRLDPELGAVWLVLQELNLPREGATATNVPSVAKALKALSDDVRAAIKNKQPMSAGEIYARLQSIPRYDPLDGFRGIELASSKARNPDGSINVPLASTYLQMTQICPACMRDLQNDPNARLTAQQVGWLHNNSMPGVKVGDPITKAIDEMYKHPAYQSHFRLGAQAVASQASEPVSDFKYAFARLGGQQFTMGDQVLAYLPGEAIEFGEPLAALERELAPDFAAPREPALTTNETPAPAPVAEVDTPPAAEPIDVPAYEPPAPPIIAPEDVPEPARPAQPAPGTRDFAGGTRILADGTPIVVNPSIYDAFRRNIGLSAPTPEQPSRPAFTAENPSPVTQPTNTLGKEATRIGTVKDEFAVFHSADQQQASRAMSDQAQKFTDSLYNKAQTVRSSDLAAIPADATARFAGQLKLQAPAPAPVAEVDTPPAAEPIDVPAYEPPAPPIIAPEDVPEPVQPAQPTPGARDFADGTQVRPDGTAIPAPLSIYDQFRGNIGLSAPAAPLPPQRPADLVPTPSQPSRPAFTVQNPSPVTQPRTPDTQLTQDTFAVFKSADTQQASRDITAALRNLDKSLYRQAQNQPPVTSRTIPADLMRQFQTDLSLRPIAAAPTQPVAEVDAPLAPEPAEVAVPMPPSKPVELTDTPPAAEPIEIPEPPILVIEPDTTPGPRDFADGTQVTAKGSPIASDAAAWRKLDVAPPQPGVTVAPAAAQIEEAAAAEQASQPPSRPAGLGTLVQFDTNLGFGSRGPLVETLQQRLIASGDLRLAHGPSGYFGPLTQRGVIRYQAKHGILQTGYVGNLTRGALNAEQSPTQEAGSPAQSAPARPTVAVGITPGDSLLSIMLLPPLSASGVTQAEPGGAGAPSFAAYAPERLDMARSFPAAADAPAPAPAVAQDPQQTLDALRATTEAMDTKAAHVRTAVAALADSGTQLQAATNIPQARKALTDLALRVAAADKAMGALAADPSVAGTVAQTALMQERKDLAAGFAGLQNAMNKVFRAAGALQGVEKAGAAMRAAQSKSTDAARVAALKSGMAALKSAVAASETALRALGDDAGIAGKVAQMRSEVAAMDERVQSFTRLADPLLSLQKAGSSLRGVTSVSGDAAQLRALTARMNAFAAASAPASRQLRQAGYGNEAALLESRTADMQARTRSFSTVAQRLLDMQAAARTMRTASDLDAAGEFFSGFEGTKRILQPAVARLVADAAAVDRAAGSNLSPIAQRMQQEVANIDIISALSLEQNLTSLGASLESQARAALASSKGSLTAGLQQDGASIQAALSRVARAEGAVLAKDLTSHGENLQQIGRGTGGLAELIKTRTQALAREEGGAAMESAARQMLEGADRASQQSRDALRAAEREADALRSGALPDTPTVTGAERVTRIAALRASLDAFAETARTLDTSIAAFTDELGQASAFSTQSAKTAAPLAIAAAKVGEAWQGVKAAQQHVEPALSASERAVLQDALGDLDSLLVSPTADALPRIETAKDQALSVLKVAVSSDDLNVSARKQQAEDLYAQLGGLTDALAAGDLGQTRFGFMDAAAAAPAPQASSENLFNRLRNDLLSNLGYLMSLLGVRPRRDLSRFHVTKVTEPAPSETREIPAGYQAPSDVMTGLASIRDYLQMPIIEDDFKTNTERRALREALLDTDPAGLAWYEANKLRSNTVTAALRGAVVDLRGMEWLELPETEEALMEVLQARTGALIHKQVVLWSTDAPSANAAKIAFIREEVDPLLREVFDLTVRTEFPVIDEAQQAAWKAEAQSGMDEIYPNSPTTRAPLQ